jgi:hypothetical protein
MFSYPNRLVDWLQVIRGEFEEPSGLRLTVTQASQRWRLEDEPLRGLLDTLVRVGYLDRTHDGVYRRRPDAFPQDGLVSAAGRRTHPHQLALLPQDALIAVSGGFNLLLVGADRRTHAAIEALRPTLSHPISAWSPGEPLTLAATGTRFLRNIGAASCEEQLRLLDWLDATASDVHLLSTTPVCLLPLVEAGRFIERLYYRLNTVRVDLSDWPDA